MAHSKVLGVQVLGAPGSPNPSCDPSPCHLRFTRSWPSGLVSWRHLALLTPGFTGPMTPPFSSLIKLGLTCPPGPTLRPCWTSSGPCPWVSLPWASPSGLAF